MEKRFPRFNWEEGIDGTDLFSGLGQTGLVFADANISSWRTTGNVGSGTHEKIYLDNYSNNVNIFVALDGEETTIAYVDKDDVFAPGTYPYFMTYGDTVIYSAPNALDSSVYDYYSLDLAALSSGAHIVQSSDLEHLGTFGSHWNRYGYKGQLFDGSNILTQQVDEFEGVGSQ